MANGIMTNKELVGSLIQDLNNLVKEQQAGQHIQASVIIVSMAQKLTNLYNTIDDDVKNRDETIDKLKDELRACGREVVEVAPEDFEKEIANGK